MNTRIGPILKSIANVFPSSHYALLSLFLFIGLELMFVIHNWLFILFAIFIGILFIGILLIRSEEGRGFHPTQMILPTLAAVGFVGLAVYLPITFFLHVYFAACAMLFFFILKYGARQAWPTWNIVISLAVTFAIIAPTIGWRFTFYTPVWVMLAVLFPTIVLLAFQSLLRYTDTMDDAIMVSLCIGFTLTEVAWILQFLPLHFIVQAGILLALYYIAIQMTISTVERSLSRKTIIEYTVIGTIAVLLLALTANWA